MRKATFLASVRDDFLAILTYISDTSGNVAVGEAFVRKLREKCHKLASYEVAVGRARPELGNNIRSFPYIGYVIFFRYVGERFEVVNILERHRDVDAFFGKTDDNQ